MHNLNIIFNHKLGTYFKTTNKKQAKEMRLAGLKGYRAVGYKLPHTYTPIKASESGKMETFEDVRDFFYSKMVEVVNPMSQYEVK